MLSLRDQLIKIWKKGVDLEGAKINIEKVFYLKRNISNASVVYLNLIYPLLHNPPHNVNALFSSEIKRKLICMHRAISSTIQLFPSSNAATATAAACITIMSSLEPARTSPAPLYYTIVPQTKSQHARCDNNTVRRDASHHVHEIGLHFDVMSRTHMSEQSALVVSELC